MRGQLPCTDIQESVLLSLGVLLLECHLKSVHCIPNSVYKISHIWGKRNLMADHLCVPL